MDVLGFSLGGFIAQNLAENYPDLIRKVILAGTGPKGGERYHRTFDSRKCCHGGWLRQINTKFIFYKNNFRLRGRRTFPATAQSRKLNRDSAATEETINAQAKAIITFGHEADAANQQLRNIKQPVLIVNGTEDIMVPSVNSFILSKELVNSKLILWSNAGHGGLFQHHKEFVNELETFLGAN